MQDGTLDKSFSDGIGIEVCADLHDVSLDEHRIMVWNVIGFAVLQVDAKWLEWLGFHPLLE